MILPFGFGFTVDLTSFDLLLPICLLYNKYQNGLYFFCVYKEVKVRIQALSNKYVT